MSDYPQTRRLSDKALEHAYTGRYGSRPDLVLATRTLVSAKNDLSHAVMCDTSGHTRTDLEPFVRNLVRAAWLHTLADLRAQRTSRRAYAHDMALVDAIAAELARRPVRLNSAVEPVWLTACTSVITGLMAHSPMGYGVERVARYAVELMFSTVSSKVMCQLAQVLDSDENVFKVIDHLHIPAVERMVSWSVTGQSIANITPRSALLTATSKLSTVIDNASEEHLNMTRDLISNYDMTLNTAAYVLEMAKCEVSRTLSLYALTRGRLYPVGVDWSAVVDMYETVGSAELVEELFGAE